MTAPVYTAPGVGAVRKSFHYTLPVAPGNAFYPLCGIPLNKAITIVQANVYVSGAGSGSPALSCKITSQVPGSAGADLGAATALTFGANGTSTDLPFTSASTKEVAAGAIVGVTTSATNGTLPLICVQVDYFDFDGHSV